MTAGLTIFNASNTVQIDQNWRNYGFRQIIPVAIGTDSSGAVRYQLNVSGSPALLCACRASTLYPFKLHSWYSSGSWRFNWLFYRPDGMSDPVTETVQFYIFDVLDTGGFSNIGLEVFLDGGPRVFHSDAPVLKTSPVQGCDTSFIGTPGRTYVPLIMRNPVFGAFIAGAGYRLCFHTLRVSGSNIITEQKLTPNGATGAYANSGAFMPVDVSGLS